MAIECAMQRVRAAGFSSRLTLCIEREHLYTFAGTFAVVRVPERPSSNAPPFTGPTRDDLLVPLINMYSVFSPVCRLHRRRRLRGLYAVVTSLVRVTCSCSLRFGIGCSSLTTAVSRLAGVASARDVGELHSPTTQQYVSCASLLLAITNFREL